MLRKSIGVAGLSALAMVAAAGTAGGQTTWTNAAGGVWSLGTNWDAGVPGVGATAIIGVPGAYLVDVNVDPSLFDFQVTNPLAIVDVDPGRTITISGPLMSNVGSVDLNSAGSSLNATLAFVNAATISGDGVIRMRTSSDNSQINTSPGALLTNSADHEITGVGQINAALDNFGVVAADIAASVSGNILVLRSEDKINRGDMLARNNSVLVVDNIQISQSPSGIVLGDAGTVIFADGSGLSGGTAGSSNGGDLQFASGTIFFSEVDMIGDWQILPGSTMQIDAEGLTNNGVGDINRNGSSLDAVIVATASTLLDGSGELRLRTGSDNAQINTVPGAVLSHALGHTMRGVGQINADLVNNGEVWADFAASVSGIQLDLRTNDKVNNNIFGARASSVLNIFLIDINQNGGGRLVADGGTISVNSANINGGSIEMNSGGVLFFATGTNELNSGVEISGDWVVVPATSVVVSSGGLVNNGSGQLNNTGSSLDSILAFDNATLSGNGEIALRTSGDNAQINTLDGAMLTHAAGHTIRGVGEINASMINAGLIVADIGVSVSGNNLRLITNNKANSGNIAVTPNSLLDIEGITLVQSPSGTLTGNDGTIRVQAGARVQGGTYNGSGTAQMSFSGSSELSNLVLNGNSVINPGGTVTVDAAGISNNGTLRMNPTGSSLAAHLQFSQSATLGGSGMVMMQSAASRAVIDSAPGAVITIGADQLIRGVGTVRGELINNGSIAADVSVSVSGNTLDITGAPKVNNASLGALTGSTLNISGTSIDQSGGGLIRIADGGTVAFANSTLVGGGITQVAPGNAGTYLISGNDVTFEGVVLEVDGRVNFNSTLTVNGPTFENNGRMQVNPAFSSLDGVVFFNQNAELTGTGEINLTANNLDSRISGAAGVVVRNGEAHTISGLGAVTTAFVNEGTVAPGTGTIAQLDFEDGYTQSPTGRFDCELSGLVADQLNVSGDAVLGGTISADALGTFEFVAGRSYTVVQADAIVGEFDDFEIGRQGNIVTRIVYEPTRVRIVTACIADANLDGVVNGIDFGAWLAAFNAGDLVADANLDGVVNGIDFGAWLGAFNTPCP